MGIDLTCLGSGRFEPDFTLANCMMTFVEVEVDTETGLVTLRRVVNATDVGQIIDPPGLEGQLNGCLGSGGIDSALFEETVLDRTTGHILNANLIDYKWRTFPDLPVIDNVVLETPIPSHRFKAVGVGEVATSPGPSAVLMAVSNAIGTWLHDYPVTPERVLQALGKIPVGRTGREPSMRSFKHLQAGTIEEALALLTKFRGKARINAGGTDLLGVLKDEILPGYPQAVIDIKTIAGLDTIREEDGRLKIGALTRLKDIVESALLRERYRCPGRSGPVRGLAADPERRHPGREPLPGGALLVFPLPESSGRRHLLRPQRPRPLPGRQGRQPLSRRRGREKMLRRLPVGYRRGPGRPGCPTGPDRAAGAKENRGHRFLSPPGPRTSVERDPDRNRDPRTAP